MQDPFSRADRDLWSLRKDETKCWAGITLCMNTCWGWLVGKQVCRKGCRHPDGQTIAHKPAVKAITARGMLPAGGGSWPFSWWDLSGVLGMVLAYPVQERHGHTGVSPVKGHRSDEGTGASVIWVQAGRTWTGEGSGENFKQNKSCRNNWYRLLKYE